MASSLRYFVEGPCEKALIKALMYNRGYHFKVGKIEVFNFINEKLSKAKARTINKEMTVVIVFDTDVNNTEVLEENIKVLRNVSQLKDDHIILMPSVKSFEDEIVYSCQKISDIHQFFNTKSVKEFKARFIKHSDLISKLETLDFIFDKLWSRNPSDVFKSFTNNSKRIRQ